MIAEVQRRYYKDRCIMLEAFIEGPVLEHLKYELDRLDYSQDYSRCKEMESLIESAGVLINPDLKKALAELNRKVKEDRRKEMESQSVVTCVYCGMEYPNGTPTAKAQILTDHIKVCEKHPMRAAEARIRQLEEALTVVIPYVTKAINESSDNNNYVYTKDKAVLDLAERVLNGIRPYRPLDRTEGLCLNFDHGPLPPGDMCKCQNCKTKSEIDNDSMVQEVIKLLAPERIPQTVADIDAKINDMHVEIDKLHMQREELLKGEDDK